MVRSIDISGLYYITHIANLSSILEHGILSHEEVTRRKLNFQPIYDVQIVNNRHSRLVNGVNGLWSYANLYFNPRNPMLYRTLNEAKRFNVAVVQVDKCALELPNVHIATGNAASNATEIVTAPLGIALIREMWPTINSEYWKEEDGSKRRIMAETLVPTQVPPELIRCIYVASINIAEEVKKLLPQNNNVEVVSEPYMFFQPKRSDFVTRGITVVDGDMFLSKRQTVTISVNTVGVMGKGLASRTKYQFPDVYVEYQERCKTKELQIGKPYLYKREISLDSELADTPSTLKDLNNEKWFLLFPTKRHWREPSRIEDIEAGLVWLAENHEQLHITSLAVPALGCGLGGLSWQDVGPLMCKYLDRMQLDSSIYLPREVQVPNEQLTAAFLLNRT